MGDSLLLWMGVGLLGAGLAAATAQAWRFAGAKRALETELAEATAAIAARDRAIAAADAQWHTIAGTYFLGNGWSRSLSTGGAAMAGSAGRRLHPRRPSGGDEAGGSGGTAQRHHVAGEGGARFHLRGQPGCLHAAALGRCAQRRSVPAVAQRHHAHRRSAGTGFWGYVLLRRRQLHLAECQQWPYWSGGAVRPCHRPGATRPL